MIYPVNIQKWFADKKSPFHEDYERLKKILPKLSCKVCGNKIKIRSGYVSHAIMYGYDDTNYCSYRCLAKAKMRREDILKEIEKQSEKLRKKITNEK